MLLRACVEHSGSARAPLPVSRMAGCQRRLRPEEGKHIDAGRQDRLLLERRMSLTELSDRVGVTLANLSILKTGKARAVRFSTLDALCRELDCQPGDLIVQTPGVHPDT